MWLFVFFDLPVELPKQRKAATDFRKRLLKIGFTMMQWSVYVRHVPSQESSEVFVRQIERFKPPEGHIVIMKITDKQFGDMVNIWGNQGPPPQPAPSIQLEIF
ncbi:CRISPR-associated endonuclease Cas2 [Nostoc sp. NIES-2111]